MSSLYGYGQHVFRTCHPPCCSLAASVPLAPNSHQTLSSSTPPITSTVMEPATSANDDLMSRGRILRREWKRYKPVNFPFIYYFAPTYSSRDGLHSISLNLLHYHSWNWFPRSALCSLANAVVSRICISRYAFGVLGHLLRQQQRSWLRLHVVVGV